jgi:hypothetical protein
LLWSYLKKNQDKTKYGNMAENGTHLSLLDAEY